MGSCPCQHQLHGQGKQHEAGAVLLGVLQPDHRDWALQASWAESTSGVQGEFKLNDVQDGFLPAAFLLGLLVATVVYAEAAKRYNAFRLIGVPGMHS